ncbi:hypothetical protein RFI_33317, partial [Reticulomyxa filosa]
FFKKKKNFFFFFFFLWWYTLTPGTGSSGKSTIFAQLRKIYETPTPTLGFLGNAPTSEEVNQWEKNEMTTVIRQNCVQVLIGMIQKSLQMYKINPILYKECCILIHGKDYLGYHNVKSMKNE